MAVFNFFRIIFITISIVALSSLVPVFTALAHGEFFVIKTFVFPMCAAVFLGILFYFAGRKKSVSLSHRTVFLLVCCLWCVISIYGAIPLFAGGFTDSFIDALFEGASGFTTTGYSVFQNVESLPRAVNLWRSQMQWLGGMGIIALTVALLPFLGIGTFKLIKAESTGPEKGQITPKIASTAKVLWLTYFAFTVLHVVALLFCGIDFTESLTIAFSSIGAGGFLGRNDSVGHYNSSAVEIICTVFMFLSAVNFSLYFYFVTGKFSEIKKNSEFKAYLLIIVIFIGALTVSLLPHYNSFGEALKNGAFQFISVLTTTGYSTADYNAWPALSRFLLFTAFFIGGCSGSSAGGFKVIRWVIFAKQAKNEILTMLHPHGVFTVSVNGRPGRKDLVFNVAAFAFLYFAAVFLTTFIGTAADIELFEAFSTSLSLIGNIGFSLGTPVNFESLSGGVKLWFSLMMIAGRLEIFNFAVFFCVDFWKK